MGEPATTDIVGAPRAAAPGPIAAPIHLVIVLVVMGFLAYSGAADANAIAHAPSFNRSIFYIVTILFEWLMLGIVVLGVRLHRSPLLTVFGDRWHSIREVARDIGIAAVFWLVAAIILSATFGPSTETVSNDVVRAMLPHGPMESSLWIALSITAGICEEAIFRGYLQRQLIAYSRSSIVGILGSAVVFGAGHSYKGGIGALRIVLFGALFGILAYWRNSVRPFVEHAAFAENLGFAGVLARLLGVRVG